MTADELRAAWYEAEVRAKYDAAAMKKMASSGAAMPNASGEPSYPIADEEDLHNAIHAVGRGHASHEAIRQHIIARAKALGLTHLLPASWIGGSDHASESQTNSAEEESEVRADTPLTDSDNDADEEDDDDDDDDDDSASSSGKGTEDQGRAEESDAETRDESAEMTDAVESNGLSDNDHKVDSADDNRRRLAAILEKRYDPYFFDSDDE